MQFDKFRPHKALEGHIRYYWMLKAPKPSPQPVSQQFLAEGVELSFNLADPVEITSPDSARKSVAQLSISGPLTKPMKLQANGRIDILGVCFRPGGAYAFFPFPAHQMTNYLPDVQAVWGAKGGEFVERFFETCMTCHQRIDYLNRFFLHQLRGNHPQDHCVVEAIKAIESCKGLISVGYLAKKTGISSRHLERKFKERVGLSPKQLCRSLRFKQVLSCKVQNPDGSWLKTALDCGYYDQAHMINDFKHYTGVSPSTYFENPTHVEPFFSANF
jgi:AraC-like DNA-binding protein